MQDLLSSFPAWVWVIAAMVVIVASASWVRSGSTGTDPTRMFTATQRSTGFRRAGMQCEMSNWWLGRCTRTASHADHFYPHSKGGATSMQNLVAACAPHNLSKSARMPSRLDGALIRWRRRSYFPGDTDRTVGQWFWRSR